jgi:hypothetical protein
MTIFIVGGRREQFHPPSLLGLCSRLLRWRETTAMLDMVRWSVGIKRLLPLTD